MEDGGCRPTLKALCSLCIPLVCLHVCTHVFVCVFASNEAVFVSIKTEGAHKHGREQQCLSHIQ